MIPRREVLVELGRLLLFHVPDPIRVVRHHVANLRQGGRFVAIDSDIGSARCEPPVPLFTDAISWICDAFVAAGATPTIGARLGTILEDAALCDVATLGIQGYLPPRSPDGPALIAGVLHTLADAIVRQGIASREQMGLDTLQQRLADALTRDRAVLLPPTLAGAWGRKPAGE